MSLAGGPVSHQWLGVSCPISVRGSPAPSLAGGSTFHPCLGVLCPIPSQGPIPLTTVQGCLRSPEEWDPEAGDWSPRGGGQRQGGSEQGWEAGTAQPSTMRPYGRRL